MPLDVKNTFAFGMPLSSAISSASSICCSIRYSVELCRIFAGLLLHGGDDLRQRVRGARGEDPAEPVEVAVVGAVPDVATLAAHDVIGSS